MLEQDSELPIHLLQSGQNLVLSPEGSGWLILQRQFYAEAVGPGAAVGGTFDAQCLSVYVCGDVKLVSLGIDAERRAAYEKRMEYIQSMQAILLEFDPVQRGTRLLEQLIDWVGLQQTQQIPHELLCQMGGLLPHNVNLAWRTLSRPTGMRTVELEALAA